MNFDELKQVCERKKINADRIELKQRISRECETILKLKVGQDATYWEQKEKLSDKERDHEALQRNMAQLQMEYETLSAKYQDELRKRPELLNKLTTASEVRRVLQENVNRVRATLERSSADRAALADAYARADAAVTAAHGNFDKRLQEAASEAHQLRNMLRVREEVGVQLQEAASRERARADRAAAAADQLREQKEAVAVQLTHINALLQEREKTIQEHRNELRRLTAEFNERQERSSATIAELEREAGAASSLRVSLKQAEMRAQAAACDVTRITSELAVAQADNQSASQRAASLTLQAQEAQCRIQKMEEFMIYINKTNESLAEKLKEKDENIQSLQKAAAEYQQELKELMVDLKERAETIEKLTKDIAEIKETRERDHRSYEEREAIRERECQDFEEQITADQRELVKRAEIIEKLMHDIAETKAVMSRAEATIAEQAAQFEKERKNSVKRIEAIEMELSEYTKTIARLNREITEEANARQQAEIALRDLSNKVERERSICEEKTATYQRQLMERSQTIEKLINDIAEIKEAREREHHDYKERIASDQRKLIDHAETIDKLTTQIEKMKELEQLHSHAETVINDLTNQLQKYHEDKDQRVNELETKLAECAITIARLEHSIDEGTNAQALAKTTLADIKKERETERRDFENRVTNIERELVEYKNANTSLENKLAEEREALSRANAALDGVKAELDRERREFEERDITTERELSARNNTIEQLRREVASGSEERARLEASLSAVRLELNKEIENVENNREEIRKLKTEAWRKDIESANQIRTIRSLNNEKDLLGKKNEELKDTIKNIKNIADPKSSTGKGAVRDLSQHDDNAVLAPPTPDLSVRPAARRPLVPRSAPNENVFDAIRYDIFNEESDSFESWAKPTNPKPSDDLRHFKDVSLHGPSTLLQAMKRQNDTVLHDQTPNPVRDMPAADRLLQASAPTPAAPPTDRPRKFFKTTRRQRKGRNE